MSHQRDFGHMPFPGHRTVAEVIEDDKAYWAPLRGKPRCPQCLRRIRSDADVKKCPYEGCQAKALAA